MSNILDALRKAQAEKVTKDHTTAGSETLFAYRSARHQSGANRRAIIFGCCGLALLAVVGWILYGSSRSPKVAVSQPTSSSTPAAPAPLPAPQPLSAPAAAQSPIQVSVPGAAAVTPAVPTAPPGKTEGDEESGSSLRRHKNRSNQEHPVVSAPATMPAARSAETAAPVVSSAPEGVKLTGIAWQENRKIRRAVINDVLVGEGTIVSGARVVEIRPDMVRFEKNGSLFEATLPR